MGPVKNRSTRKVSPFKFHLCVCKSHMISPVLPRPSYSRTTRTPDPFVGWTSIPFNPLCLPRGVSTERYIPILVASICILTVFRSTSGTLRTRVNRILPVLEVQSLMKSARLHGTIKYPMYWLHLAVPDTPSYGTFGASERLSPWLTVAVRAEIKPAADVVG